MYIVDTKNNKLIKASKCKFKDLGFEERKHLQEWIAKEPNSLGEELLIIQKEFDGFKDTRERLDLLALDKQGCLVVIENKLDDSGRDVTWQAIKYASYCSSLSKQEVIDIYQSYLGTTGNASDKISDFFDGKDIADIKINEGNTQRMFFVAANFRKEITSSVLWLSNFNLRIKCFKVTPYKYGDNIMVDFDQIIPIKDAEDYTIKMASKKQEEESENESTQRRHNARSSFWQEFIAYDKANNPYAESKGTTDNWLGKQQKGVTVNVNISLNQSMVDIYINNGSWDSNKATFDKLYEHKDDIEKELGALEWMRLDDRVTSRICIFSPLSYQNEEDKEAIFKFFITNTNSFLKTFVKYSKYFKK